MASPEASPFSEDDRQQLAERGISEAEIVRQWALLQNPPPPAHLDRPCIPGDGILQLTAEQEAAALAGFDAAANRWSKMVPASGAASRMFAPLLKFLDEGGEADPNVLAFCSRLQDFAFWQTVGAEDRRRLEGWQRRREFASLLRFLLLEDGDGGLGLSTLPKGLIPFHRNPAAESAPLTAAGEHLLEAAHLFGEGHEERLCFTVSPDLVAAFHAHLPAGICLSPQSPATDTVALGTDGALVRQTDGRLLFRPGGHGALIRNLHALALDGAELVLIKNIDNVQPEPDSEVTLRWKKILGGTLLGLQAQAHSLLVRLETGETAAVEEALLFLQEKLGVDPARVAALSQDDAERRAFAVHRLDRPLRVCGVVLNQGEPGGGPFWVRSPDGSVSRQIIEGAQIDKTVASQQAALEAATHFNPVDLACAVRDHRGEPFDLPRFVDPQTAFVADKTHEGQPLKALERPGLWNGAMAHWNTVFLEVPAATFTPVKTVLDLLRPEHV